MKISFTLKKSIYDCKLQINDAQGSKYFLIPALNGNETPEQCITVNIYGNEFDLTVIPLTSNYMQPLNEFEADSLTNKLNKKVTKFLFSSLEKMILRVGCSYHINGLQDGNIVDINLQNYTFGSFDRFNLLDLIPMIYMFFEVSHLQKRFEPSNAFETNRKDVIKAAKAMSLTDILGNGILATLFTYPIQVGRIKRLSKNKKISKMLLKFHNMSDVERQKLLEKQEKMFNT